MKIYGDLLSILNNEKHGCEKIVLTRVQTKLNVPFDRLKVYLSDLASLGLIEDATSCIITQKGKDYMAEYKAVIEFMERMGISYQ